jgi:hypothetical protein
VDLLSFITRYAIWITIILGGTAIFIFVFAVIRTLLHKRYIKNVFLGSMHYKYKKARYKGPVPKKVYFEGELMTVVFKDGDSATISIQPFPRLMNATEEQRNNWRKIGPGEGIHWEDVDEHISVYTILKMGGKPIHPDAERSR